MTAVWYIGGADVRSISSAEWASAGIGGVAQSVWNVYNGWSIPATSFTAPQLALLAADGSFNTQGADGSRPGAPGSTNQPSRFATLAEVASATVDWRTRKFTDFKPDRDLPGTFAWYDASTLSVADGAAVPRFPDLSGYGNDLANKTVAQQPTLKRSGQNGMNTVVVASGQVLKSLGESWRQGGTAARPQPLTYVALMKSTQITNALSAVLSTFGTGTGIPSQPGWTGMMTTYSAFESGISLSAGSGGTGAASKTPNDGLWHVMIGVMSPTGYAVYLDGKLITLGVTQAQGPQPASGPIQLGNATGYAPWAGEFAEGGIINAELTDRQVSAMTRYLNTKWNLGLLNFEIDWSNYYVDLVDAGGQTVRAYPPRNWAASGNATVLVGHHQGGTPSQVSPSGGYSQFYPAARVLAANGYLVLIPNYHGDTWNSDLHGTDGVAAVTAGDAYMGGSTQRLVLAGYSMGGMGAMTEFREARHGSKVKGVLTIDAPFDTKLTQGSGYAASYGTALGITVGTLSGAGAALGATSLPTAASFPTVGTHLILNAGTATEEVVTTTAPSGSGAVAVTATQFAHVAGEYVTNYPDKIGNKNPLLWVAADLPKGARFYIMSSAADTTVVDTRNSDLMVTVLNTYAQPASMTVRKHGYGHLAATGFNPLEILDFCNSCV